MPHMLVEIRDEQAERLTEFCQIHQKDPEHITRSALDLFLDVFDGKLIVNKDKPIVAFSWGRAFLWLVVLPLLLIVLGILCGKIVPDFLIWAWKGFPVKPF